MEILDRFKKKDEPKEAEQDIINFFVPLPDGVSEMQVIGLKRMQKFSHRDNSVTELVLGNIERVEGNNAFMLNSADYISFEIPVGQKITEATIITAINQYAINKSSRESKSKSFYIGQIQDGNIVGKSAVVEQYADQIVSNIEAERYKRSEEKRRSIEESEKRMAEKQKNEILRQGNEYKKERADKHARRMQNPYLIQVDTYKYQGRNYSDYDGIDMVNGDILRFRHVDKVGKDSNGNYLYSGYINKTENEHDVELLSINSEDRIGDYICFTLPGRLEDFVRAGNQDQIVTILRLLSDERIHGDGLTYIGGIDANGTISRENLTRGPIADKIIQMQQEYLAKKQGTINRNTYNNDEGR